MRPDIAAADQHVTNRQQNGARGVQGSVQSGKVRDRDHTRLFITGCQDTKKNYSPPNFHLTGCPRLTRHNPHPARYTRHPRGLGRTPNVGSQPSPQGRGWSRVAGPGEGFPCLQTAEKVDSKGQVSNLQPPRCAQQSSSINIGIEDYQ